MFAISEESKKRIEQSSGFSFSYIVKDLSYEEEIAGIYSITGKKIRFSKERKRGFAGRGNPDIARRRIRTIEDVNLAFGIGAE